MASIPVSTRMFFSFPGLDQFASTNASVYGFAISTRDFSLNAVQGAPSSKAIIRQT
jgi:hypothetical protein